MTEDTPQVVVVSSVFRYEKEPLTRNKTFQLLCRSDHLIAGVQVVGEGGETNLHSHRNKDGFWFVLKGRARFYTTDDEVLAELGPNEGVLVPRNFPYWFERVGDVELEILQVEASSVPMTKIGGFLAGDDRIDHAPPRPDLAERAAELRSRYGD